MADARRFSDVTMKASHNTYDVNWPLTTMKSSGGWSFPVYEAGCRAVELDVGQYGGPDPGRQMQWSVQHGGDYNLHFRQLSQFLAELRGWSDATRDHDVVTIFMCLKGIVDRGPFPELLDRYVAQFLCGNDLDRLYRPADLLAKSGAGDLRAAARKKGWPTLDEMRGRFLLVMTGFHASLAHYAESPKDRLGFACIDCTDDEVSPAKYIDGKPNQLFLNYHLFGDHRKTWVSCVQGLPGRPVGALPRLPGPGRLVGRGRRRRHPHAGHRQHPPSLARSVRSRTGRKGRQGVTVGQPALSVRKTTV